MKWMQAVCRNFRADLRGFIAATAAVISFSAPDAQNDCRLAAEINAGLNANRGAVDKECRQRFAGAAPRCAWGRLDAGLMVE
jgi:hypothetical protein